MCGDAPLLINFVYVVDLSVAFFHFLPVYLIYLLILGIVSNLCIKQKGTECV